LAENRGFFDQVLVNDDLDKARRDSTCHCSIFKTTLM